jgi:hypothetical protein
MRVSAQSVGFRVSLLFIGCDSKKIQDLLIENHLADRHLVDTRNIMKVTYKTKYCNVGILPVRQMLCDQNARNNKTVGEGKLTYLVSPTFCRH